MGSLLAGAEAEVPLGLAISWAAQQKDSLAGWGQLGELVEGQGLASSSNDSVAGSLGKLEGCDSESLRDVEQTGVVGDRSDHSNNAGVVLGLSLCNSCVVLGEVPGDSRDGDGVAVEPRLVESLVDDLIELGLGSSGEEGVELHEMWGTLMRVLR